MDLCESNNINAFSRAFVVTTLVAIVTAPFLGWGGAAVLQLGLAVFQSKWLLAKINVESRTAVREPFVDGAPVCPHLKEPNAFPELARSPAATVRKPTPGNPFMNVLIDEIKYNPTRPPADNISDPNNVQTLDNFFRIQWTNDPTDVFGRSQGQREFQAMPSTSIPNDRQSQQNWLQLIPGKTCKEGGRDACIPGTNGGPVTWLNQPN